MQSVKKTKRLLVIDNAWLTCGASSEILTRALEICQEDDIAIPSMSRMGFAPTTCPTTRPLENLFYPNGRTIAVKAHQMVGGKKAGLWEPAVDAKTEIDAFKGPF
jgi:pyruvate dehydrogenase E1 component beta subunit